MSNVCLSVRCLAAQQHASVSQRRVRSDNFTCCHTETEIADQTVYLTQSQYTDTGPTSPRADPIMPGAWRGSHWSTSFLSPWYESTRKNPVASGIRTPDFPLPWRTPYPLGQRGGHMSNDVVDRNRSIITAHNRSIITAQNSSNNK